MAQRSPPISGKWQVFPGADVAADVGYVRDVWRLQDVWMMNRWPRDVWRLQDVWMMNRWKKFRIAAPLVTITT